MEKKQNLQSKFSIVQQKASILSNIKRKLLDQSYLNRLQERIVQIDKKVTEEEISNQRLVFQYKMNLKRINLQVEQMEQKSKHSLSVRMQIIKQIKEEISDMNMSIAEDKSKVASSLQNLPQKLYQQMALRWQSESNELFKDISQEKTTRKNALNNILQAKINKIISNFRQKQAQNISFSKVVLQRQQAEISQLCRQFIVQMNKEQKEKDEMKERLKEELQYCVLQVKKCFQEQRKEAVKNKEKMICLMKNAFSTTNLQGQ